MSRLRYAPLDMTRRRIIRKSLAKYGCPSYHPNMRAAKAYYVYILSNQSRTLYIGITGNIQRRVWQHKTKAVDGGTCRYQIDTLVHVESFGDVWSAIAREKQLKRWSRVKKLRLIGMENPDWRDLSDGWYG